MSMLCRMSEALNHILLGARIKSEADVIGQWNFVIFSYTINLLLVFLAVAGLFALAGIYQPFVAPLAKPAFQVVLAVTNLVTFVLMYITSLSWKMNEAAIERLRAARRSKAEYRFLLAALAATSLLFSTLLFLTFDFALLAGAACMNAMLLQCMWSQRVLEFDARE